MTHIKQFLEDEQLKNAKAEVAQKLQEVRAFESKLISRHEELSMREKEYHQKVRWLDESTATAKLWLGAAIGTNLMWSLYLLTR
jgi:hypothetical protein